MQVLGEISALGFRQWASVSGLQGLRQWVHQRVRCLDRYRLTAGVHCKTAPGDVQGAQNIPGGPANPGWGPQFGDELGTPQWIAYRMW